MRFPPLPHPFPCPILPSQGPFAYLRKGFGGPRRDGPPQGSAEGEGEGEGWGGLGVLLPHHHLLDDLARCGVERFEEGPQATLSGRHDSYWRVATVWYPPRR